MTVSDHLVDAVPDDDTWYSSLAEAARTLAESQKTATRVLAMGLPATEVEVAIAHRLTLDTDQLCLNEQNRAIFPASLRLLGYESIVSRRATFAVGCATTASWPGCSKRLGTGEQIRPHQPAP